MFFFSVVLATPCFGQNESKTLKATIPDKGKAILFHITGGGHLPAADMAKRYGPTGSIGARWEYLSDKNWLFGFEGEYIFGNRVRENTVAILQTNDGYIIGNDLSPASLFLLARGGYGGFYFGKVIPLGNTRSGLRMTMGGGYIRHHIRLQDDTRSVTQITGAYAKGYDRLSGGYGLNQFLGWHQMSNSRRVNFTIGIECNQGITHTLRDWDVSTMRKLSGRRLDLRFGIRAGWILPFYLVKSAEIFY